MNNKNRICLWYDGTAQEAAEFYAKTFPDSAVNAIHLAPGDYPSGKQGDVITVDFTVIGIPCIGLNGGPTFKHNEAFSFQIATDDQAETDRLWNAIIDNGGQASACGWCKDKWGLSWQISPRVLVDAVTSSDKAVAKRAFEAMMTMTKIDIAAIEAAVKGEPTNHHHHSPCRSELARDSAGTANIDANSPTAIASKLAPTLVGGDFDFATSTDPPVGASLLAKAPVQPP